MSMPAGGWQSDSGLLDVYDVAETVEHNVLIEFFVSFGVLTIFLLIFYIASKDE